MIWKAQFLEDEAFSSSSDFNKNHSAKFCRLNSSDGKANWSSKSNDLNQWLQVDLGKTETISAVAVQGRFNNPQWVTKYNLLISDDLKNWETFENNDGVHDQETVSIFQFPSNIQGRYIRFLPLEWHGHISMRVDVAITNEKIEWIAKIIDDSAFSSSSDFNEDHSARFSRLHSTSGKANWSAKVNDRNQWLQVDLGKLEFIVAVAVQGRFNHKQWVSRYSLQISTDLEKWEKFENISGSSDQEKVSEFHLPKSIQGRYVRFLPQEWHKHISMRIDVGLIAAGKLSNEDVKKSPSDLKLGNVDEKSNKVTQEKDWAEAKEIAMKLAKLKADLISKNEAEEKANKEAALKLANEVAAKAKREAEEKAKVQKEAAEKARKEAELKAQKAAGDKEKNEFVPLASSRKWQPFLMEVCSKLHQPIDYSYEFKNSRGDIFYCDINPIPDNPASKYSLYHSFSQLTPGEYLKNIFKDLDIWTEFLVKEDFLLISPLKENFVELEINKIVLFDQHKLDNLYDNYKFIVDKLPNSLLVSRKNYPQLLRQYLTRILKRDEVYIDCMFFSALKNCEPEVYQEYVTAFANIPYAKMTSIRFVLKDRSIKNILKIYKDFIPTYKALRNQILFTVDDLELCPELNLFEEYGNKFKENQLVFSDFLRTFWLNPKRSYDLFDLVLNYIIQKEQYSYHLGKYVYINPKDWTEKQLWERHLNLLEYVVECGKSDLSDELYIDKMEFEKRFG